MGNTPLEVTQNHPARYEITQEYQGSNASNVCNGKIDTHKGIHFPICISIFLVTSVTYIYFEYNNKGIQRLSPVTVSVTEKKSAVTALPQRIPNVPRAYPGAISHRQRTLPIGRCRHTRNSTKPFGRSAVTGFDPCFIA